MTGVAVVAIVIAIAAGVFVARGSDVATVRAPARQPHPGGSGTASRQLALAPTGTMTRTATAAVSVLTNKPITVITPASPTTARPSPAAPTLVASATPMPTATPAPTHTATVVPPHTASPTPAPASATPLIAAHATPQAHGELTDVPARRKAHPKRPHPITHHPTPRHVRMCAGARPACPPSSLLPGTLLIADRGNNRLLMVDTAGHVVWQFPRPGDLRPGQVFAGPDDAFFTPDGRYIVTNQEETQTLGIVDYRHHRLVWQYGHPYYRGDAPGYLNEPDDAYVLPNGLITVADIRNCRILFLSRAGKVVRQYGRTGVCVHDPPTTFASPNGDTPLPDGGMLVTEIGGSNVVRLNAQGRVVWSISVPSVAYPSDAQLLPDGSVLMADYSWPGGIVRVSPHGQLLWRYMPTRPSHTLNHPSLAIMLPNGLIATNDDWNHRVVLIDPRRQAIVWQYGHTAISGSAPGYLDVPDGIDFRPASR